MEWVLQEINGNCSILEWVLQEIHGNCSVPEWVLQGIHSNCSVRSGYCRKYTATAVYWSGY